MSELYDELQEAAAAVRARIGERKPTVGMILGSGLGSFAERLEDAVAIDYGDIPHFPRSTVHGHAGRLKVGTLAGVTVVAMQGRVHFYEGHTAATAAFPARTLITLGAQTLVITNAAGGVNVDFEPGQLMIINDHLNMIGQNPLLGDNDERLGPRFPDMTTAYDPELRQLAKAAGAELGIDLVEGVYVALSGPTYETPAEVRMLRALGADATGMSTVPEVIVANHMGARVLGISCITNKAAGITGEALSHDEVTDTATRIRSTFENLLENILGKLGAQGSGDDG